MAIVFTKKQYHQLVKEDFWTKIELHFVLFGDEHPILRDDSVPLIMYDYKDPTFIGPVQPDPFVNLSFHGPITSDKIPDPNVLMYSVRHNRVQSLMDSIDGFIDDYVQLEKLIKTPNTIHREIKTLRNPYIFSINETGYQAIGLYKLLEKKQVVVIPPELIKSMEEGGLNMAVSLLPKLHENMIYLLNHGRNPPRLNSSFSPEPQAEPVEDAPESIKRGRLRANTSTDKIDTPLPTLKDWGKVSFCVLNEGQFEIQAAGKNYTIEEIFSGKPPSYLIAFLYQIVIKGGVFDNKSFPKIKKGTVRQYKERLCTLLKNGFQINATPILYNKKAKAYQSAFRCDSEVNPTQDDYRPKDSIPSDSIPSGVQVDKIRNSLKFHK